MGEMHMTHKTDRDLERYRRMHKGHYRHAVVKPIGNIYAEVRARMGLSQKDVAERVGVSRKAWQYRETVKVMYYPMEILALKELSGLTWEEMGEIINEVA